MSAGIDLTVEEYAAFLGAANPAMAAASPITVALPRVNDDLGVLAPGFRALLTVGLERCREAGFDVMVYEGLRSPELQYLYWCRGRTIIPPTSPVTNARTPYYSWHGYGLAVDVISKKDRWFNPNGPKELQYPRDATPEQSSQVRMRRTAYQLQGQKWFRGVAEILKATGLDWGGDWKRADLPHFQFGTLRASPSDRARALLAEGGVEAVWKEVGAL